VTWGGVCANQEQRSGKENRSVIDKDLRGFIAEVEKVNLLRHIHGAHPNLEIGGITEVAAQLPECPALLFDRIVGYPAGFRIFTNPINTPQRAALALGIDPNLRPVEALAAWINKRLDLNVHHPVPVTVA